MCYPKGNIHFPSSLATFIPLEVLSYSFFPYEEYFEVVQDYMHFISLPRKPVTLLWPDFPFPPGQLILNFI